MTKLECLIEILENKELDYSQEILDNLILGYYTNQHSSRFDTAEGTFLVLSSREIKDKLMPLAEDLLEDELENLRYSRWPTLSFSLIDAIDKDVALEGIIDGLTFEDEFDVKVIGKCESYIIYEEL